MLTLRILVTLGFSACIYLLGMSFSQGHAGTLQEAQITGQALQYMDGGNVSACGLRVMVVENVEPSETHIRIIDGSFIALLKGYGMVKGYYLKPTVHQIMNKQLELDALPIKHVWFKSPGQPATQPTSPVLESDEPKNALLYTADFALTMELLDAALTGKAIQVGFQSIQDTSETVLYGQVKVSDGDLQQLAGCIGEMAKLNKSMLRNKARKKAK